MITTTISISKRIVMSYAKETGHPVMSLTESQWKLRQIHDQNFPMEAKPLQNKY